MKRGYASTPEGQIHFYNHGRGQPLLMLHETPRSAWSFAPLMRKLGTKFNCFAPDTLGFGMSDAPAPGTRMEDLANDTSPRATSFRSPCRPLQDGARVCRCMAPTTTRRMAPAFAITCM